MRSFGTSVKLSSIVSVYLWCAIPCCDHVIPCRVIILNSLAQVYWVDQVVRIVCSYVRAYVCVCVLRTCDPCHSLHAYTDHPFGRLYVPPVDPLPSSPFFTDSNDRINEEGVNGYLGMKLLVWQFVHRNALYDESWRLCCIPHYRFSHWGRLYYSNKVFWKSS